MASVGQIPAHSVQLTHACGRGSQGTSPAISRQTVGQTATQSPQPVHRDSSSTGSSPNNRLMRSRYSSASGGTTSDGERGATAPRELARSLIVLVLGGLSPPAR